MAAFYFDRKSITEQRWTLDSSNIVENFEAQVATVIIYEKVYFWYLGSIFVVSPQKECRHTILLKTSDSNPLSSFGNISRDFFKIMSHSTKKRDSFISWQGLMYTVCSSRKTAPDCLAQPLIAWTSKVWSVTELSQSVSAFLRNLWCYNYVLWVPF